MTMLGIELRDYLLKGCRLDVLIEVYPVFLLLALRIPQKLRILGSMVVILVVFLVTAIFVKVDMAPLPFFSVTMIKIIIINCELLNFNANLTAVMNNRVSDPQPDALKTPDIIQLFHQSAVVVEGRERGRGAGGSVTRVLHPTSSAERKSSEPWESVLPLLYVFVFLLFF